MAHTQTYTLTFICPNADNSLGTFSVDNVNECPIYSRTTAKDTTQHRVLDGIITKLHYHKQVYMPSVIEATILLTHTPTFVSGTDTDYLTAENIRGIFEQAAVELTTTITDDTTSVETTVARNFLVYQMTPIFRQEAISNSQMGYAELKLLIYSMDKLFDITKSSRSYVGMRLGHDIMTDGAAYYKVDDLLAPVVNYENMAFLNMDEGQGSEAIQPFLVQYNETFYTMLARTANRCGEYLYFENGQLNLGLKVQDTPLKVTCDTKEEGKLLLSAIEYPSKTVNPFEGITVRYQRNPLLSEADNTKFTININGYSSLPSKESIRKMEEDIYALRFNIEDKCPTEIKKGDKNTDGNEYSDAEITARQYDIYVWNQKHDFNTIIDDWIKQNNKKEANEADKALRKIQELPIRLEQCEYKIKDLNAKIEEAQAQLTTKTQEVAQALANRDSISSATNQEEWLRLDLIYQQELAKVQEINNTIDNYTSQIEAEETKKAEIEEQIATYPTKEGTNPKQIDTSGYFATIKGYWTKVQAFINDTLKKSTYYTLANTTETDTNAAPHHDAYVKTVGYTTEKAKIDALVNDLPLSKEKPQSTSAERRLVQDFIPGADDYFGVGANIKDNYTDMLGCISSKGTMTGAIGNMPKGKANVSGYAYAAGFIAKFLKTNKPLATFVLDMAVADGEAVLLAIEQAAIANNSYDEYFYNGSNIKDQLGPQKGLEDYVYTEKEKDGKWTKKKLFYTGAKLPSRTYEKYEYNTLTHKDDDSSQPFIYSTSYSVLKSDFYKLISKFQSIVSEEQIVLHVRTSENAQVVLLGDTINHNNQNYIVIEDDATFDANAPQRLTQRLVAVPTIEGSAIPPVCPQGHFGHTGPQTGKVIDNFDPDKMGRVRVQFNWQEEEVDAKYQKPTPYIRVATLHATTSKGGIYLRPRIGDEVMLSFEHDNPERPYVSASLFNKSNTPLTGSAYSPNTFVIASHNGHNITIADENNLEFLGPIIKVPFLKAALATNSDNNYLSDTNENSFAGGITMSDFLGMYKISASSTSRNITLSSPFGDVKIDAFTGISIEAPHGDIKISGKNVTIEARNNVKITSGKADEDAKKGYGQQHVDALKGTAKDLLKKYITPDLGLVRCVIERFLEPIEGSILIKSPNYLKLEAGDGVTSFENIESNNPQNYLGEIDADTFAKLGEPQTINYLIGQTYKVFKNRLEAILDARTRIQQEISSLTTLENLNNDQKKALLKEGQTLEINPYISWALNSQVNNEAAKNKFYTMFKTSDEIRAAFNNHEGAQDWVTCILQQERRIVALCSGIHAHIKYVKNISKESIAAKIKNLHSTAYNSLTNPQQKAKHEAWKDKYESALDELSNILSDFEDTYYKKPENLRKVVNNKAQTLKKAFRCIAYGYLTNQKTLTYDPVLAGRMLQNISPSTQLAVSQAMLEDEDASDSVAGLLNRPTLAQKTSVANLLDDTIWAAWVSGWQLIPPKKEKGWKDFGLDVVEDYTNFGKSISEIVNLKDYLSAKKGWAAINNRQPGTILISSQKGHMLTQRDGHFKLVQNTEGVEALRANLLQF